MKHAHYYSLDAWRGIACLLVIAFHATFYVADAGAVAVLIQRFGWLGVTLFFVISGYCIAASADRSRLRDEPAINFARRRFRRIYPTYWAAVALAVVAALALSLAGQTTLYNDAVHPIQHPAHLGAVQWLGNLALIESWRPLVAGPPLRYFMGIIWTLCYEEQFYALAVLLLALSRARFFAGLGAVTLLTILAQRVALAFGQYIEGAFFDGHWHLFWCGSLVYLWRTRPEARWRPLILAVFCAYGLSPFWLKTLSATHHMLPVGLPVGAAFALLLCALSSVDEGLGQARGVQWLGWCGKRCYSLYLLHWPITKILSHALFDAGLRSEAATLAVTLPLCIGLSVAAAAVFYQLVEQRFLSGSAAAATREARLTAGRD